MTCNTYVLLHCRIKDLDDSLNSSGYVQFALGNVSSSFPGIGLHDFANFWL